MGDNKKTHFVYVTSYVGNLGTKILIEKKSNDLRKHYSDEYIGKVLTDCGCMPLFNLSSINYIDIEEISKGGVLAALWKICERNKLGLKYSLSKIPILQGTIELSNFFGINPYRLMTENAYVIITDELLEDISCIGETNNGKKRVRIDGETEAFLIRYYRDELNKVCDY